MSTEYIWEEVDIDPMVALGVVEGIAAGVDLAGLDYSLLLAFFCSQYSAPIKNDKTGKFTTSRPCYFFRPAGALHLPYGTWSRCGHIP
jgi:hypothetical protein